MSDSDIDPNFFVPRSATEVGEKKRAIYVDEGTYQKILNHSEAFKSPGHFVAFLVKNHLWMLRDRNKND